MKPAVFDYHSPTTLEESVRLLDEHGFDAKILAGGQSLIPMMNMRLARSAVIIDINQVEHLNYIRITDTDIHIGGMTRQYQVEHSSEIQDVCPLIIEGLKLVGHSQIRSRGTIGGSIIHADPTAELPVILALLGGTVTLASREGERILAADELFLTYMTTTIEPEEILVSIRFPLPSKRTGQAIEEFTLRSGDFAIVLTAASVTLDEAGKVAEATLVLGGVDGVPVVAEDVTNRLLGQTPEDDLIHKSTADIGDMIEPEADIHASEEYRKDLSVTLSNRVLKKAVARARNQHH